MASTDQIIRLAGLYGTANSIADITVSARVFGDTKKLSALKGGADITIGRYNATIQWFSDHWPTETAWPVDIVRPEPTHEPLPVAS